MIRRFIHSLLAPLLVVAFLGGLGWMALQMRPGGAAPAQSVGLVDQESRATSTPRNRIMRTATPTPTAANIMDAPAAVQEATYQERCMPKARNPLPEKVCGELKRRKIQRDENRAFATAKAMQPTRDPKATPWVQPTPTPYTLTEKDRQVYQLSGTEPITRWFLGTVVGPHSEPYGVTLVPGTCDPNPFHGSCLRMGYHSMPDTVYESAYKDQTWLMPYDIGLAKIINVTAQDGTVFFEGIHGERGSFDLRTHTWWFDEKTLLTTATVTPWPTLTPDLRFSDKP